MPIGQSKAMWQCKLYNLVANFRTNASDVTWLPRNQNMHILRNTGNLKLPNTRASQSRLSSQREQTLSTVSWFWCLPEEVGGEWTLKILGDNFAMLVHSSIDVFCCSATNICSQFNWPVISHPNTFGSWVVMQSRYSLVQQQMNMTTGEATAV